MFIGQSRHNLDDKNRLIIPVKFRHLFPNGLVIALGYSCITLADKQTFDQELEELAITNPEKYKTLTRLISGNAEEVELDKSGRIIIPGFLINEMPELKDSRELVIIGARKHLEIWPKERWINYFEKSKDLLKEH